MRRSLAFEHMAATAWRARAAPQGPGWDAPRCLGWDLDAGLLAFDFLPDARSGADLAAADEFGEDLAEHAGLAIGALHGLTGVGAGAPTDPPVLPSAELLDGLPLAVFAACSAAELDVWRLMQQDRPLVAAIDGLLGRQAAVPHVPAHCDLRLEQFLLAKDTLHVCDWEEFRLADPARDVGSFAGEWLHRAVIGMADQGRRLGETASHAEIVSQIAAGIDRVRPLTAAFWSGYRMARPDTDAGLAGRAAAFAGWHLFDRMLAAARRAPRLSGLDRAAAGIGRMILLSPAEFTGTLGLVG